MNTAARLTGLGAVFTGLLAFVPEQYAFYVAMLIFACSALSAAVPPPSAQSRWVIAYQVITMIGLNIGWAENRLKPGVSALRVSREDKPAAKEAVQAKGIPVLNKKGKPEAPT
ncbi:hypothetical protein [Komagataeibacter sp. FNDCR2]|uniref:hypothetical protein n=1 Tax=Komagataeibacter sp. FNDCR2 TaxID=2878682 RepID=UPI001E646286|nr:hypothetical protein [Komagataeibacter sp. FNDCR2]MCE2574397.1 hypothetical protein [Komagataeibacter sp. FNDCR2]